GFLFGTQSSEEIFMTNQFENQNAIVWRTVDGGDSWSGKELCKGEIFTAFQSEDALYCVSKRSSKEAYALVDTSKIFASYDWGESWVELASFSRYYVRHVGFFNRDSGMALVY